MNGSCLENRTPGHQIPAQREALPCQQMKRRSVHRGDDEGVVLDPDDVGIHSIA